VSTNRRQVQRKADGKSQGNQKNGEGETTASSGPRRKGDGVVSKRGGGAAGITRYEAARRLV